MTLRILIGKFWLFGLSIGFAFAMVLTAIFTIWDWAENPGEIFRDSSGTNWAFIYDTAASWFLPTFLSVFIVASILHLIVSKLIMIYKTKFSNDSET